MYNIYPILKYQTRLDGTFTFEKVNLFCEKNKNVFIDLQKIVELSLVSEEEANVKYLDKLELGHEEYEIFIKPEVVEVYASSEAGFYYATKTLKQILVNNELECVHIIDKPDLKIRGFMHDISRNKVPKVETIKYIIDIMSDLKMNHFELYVEGFSFEYKSFPQYLEDECYISVEEYKEIEKYANEHYIDFVPNQNGFGHMTEWLKKEEFKELAEAPEGIHLWGTHRLPSTLNALDPKSLELVRAMYKDMLCIANSKYFNMNFDEPFELGKNKTKEACLKYGEGKVYMDYALKAYDIIKEYNKIPMIWGDVLIKHNDVLDLIPKDMIFLDWGYEAESPFYSHLRKLKEAKIKFMAAPATTSWCTLLTRTQDWLENISSAIWNIYNLEGEGVLLTDWGDIGHPQFLPVSFAPLVYAGLLSYRVKNGTFKYLRDYLNQYIFKDKLKLAADVYMDAGSYYKYEPKYTDNGTVTFYSMVWILHSFKETDQIEYFKRKIKSNLFSKEQYILLLDFLKQKKKEINMCAIDELFKAEMINSFELLEVIAKVNIGYQENIGLEFRLKALEEAYQSIDGIISDFKKLWLVRNKYSHLDESVENLLKIKEFAMRSINYYRGGKNGTQN